MKVLSLLLTGLLAAQAGAAGLSPRELVELALGANNELRAQREQERAAGTEIDRVSGEFGPRIEAVVGVGPNTRATGNAISVVEDKGSFGRTFLADLKLTQPLYAWDRSSDYSAAARAGVAVKQAESALKAAEIRFQVKEAYFGFLYAKTLLDFVEGGKKDLKRVLEEQEKDKKIAKGKLYKLQIFAHEVDGKEAELRKGLSLAEAALALRAGQPSDYKLVLKESWLGVEDRPLRALTHYQELARRHRGEFQQLASGIEAKTRLASAERKAVLPVLALLATYNWADTDVRTRQSNPFAYDPYNRSVFTIGVGFKLDLQWTKQRAQAEKYASEAAELEAKSRFASDGINLEVAKAYWEAEEAGKRLESATKAYKIGKKWLGGEAMAYGAGLGKNQDLVEAYGVKAETTRNYFESIYRHHLAWATLSRVVGTEVDPVFLD